MNRHIHALTLTILLATAPIPALAEPFHLLTGVDAGQTPGPDRFVFPQTGFPGTFQDGDRLAGTPGTVPTSWLGGGTPILDTNQFGALSFMFRRGSVPAGGPPNNPNRVPVLAIEYLGGPRLDLDGDPGNGPRSLTPVANQTAVAIPGSTSLIDLGFGGATVTLNNVDLTGTNAGAAQLADPGFGVTVNTLAGTQPDGTLGGPINPSTDTRQGTLTPLAPGVTRIDHLGYEIWQDSIGLTSSTADTLGTLQFLGAFRGWRIDRDAQGNFPTLAGLGLGSTLWPDVDVSNIGGTFNEASQPSPLPPGTTTITDGPLNDAFSASGNGGVALAGGDLGAYFDQVVVPLIDPLSDSFVYLEAAGFGINNSLDPVFGDTNGYDIVLIAQSAPVPEPATAALLLFAAAALFTRRPR